MCIVQHAASTHVAPLAASKCSVHSAIAASGAFRQLLDTVPQGKRMCRACACVRAPSISTLAGAACAKTCVDGTRRAQTNHICILPALPHGASGTRESLDVRACIVKRSPPRAQAAVRVRVRALRAPAAAPVWSSSSRRWPCCSSSCAAGMVWPPGVPSHDVAYAERHAPQATCVCLEPKATCVFRI